MLTAIIHKFHNINDKILVIPYPTGQFISMLGRTMVCKWLDLIGGYNGPFMELSDSKPATGDFPRKGPIMGRSFPCHDIITEILPLLRDTHLQRKHTIECYGKLQWKKWLSEWGREGASEWTSVWSVLFLVRKLPLEVSCHCEVCNRRVIR